MCRRTGAGGGSAVLDMFAPANRRVAFIAVMVFVLQQYAGINALVYFSTDIFKQVVGQDELSCDSDTFREMAIQCLQVRVEQICSWLL